MLAGVFPMDVPAGGVLTMVVPLGIFIGLLFWGFFQRKRFN